MRESIARRAALGTGLLVVGAVALFAAVQQRDVAGSVPRDPSTVVSISAQDTAPDAVRDVPVRDSTPGAIRPLEPRPPPDKTPPSPDPSSDILAFGALVYDEQRCAACHSIAGVGSPRSPLDGAGSRLTAPEIRLWIVDPQAMRPGIRKPAFNDLPDAEVEALVAFIQSLR